jgi:NADH:ubiquinone oxidoreductase subunit 3 (subunit A)
MAFNPISWFFSMGDRVAKDIKRKADWDFYLLIIMFIAFATILFDNLYLFYLNQRFYNLGWSFVMLAILYFQYFGLKAAYEFRKALRSEPKEIIIESKDEMLDAFKKDDTI